MADVIGDTLLARIETIPSGDGAEERRRQVDELVEQSGRRRGPLERLSAKYLARLHNESGDYAATEALRVVAAALARIPPPERDFAWQRRERRRNNGGRRRRR